MGKEVKVLKHHPHFRTDFFNVLDIFGQIDAIHNDTAPLMFFKPIDAADKGRFSGPRRPTDDNTLLFCHGEVNILEHMKIPEPFVHIDDFNDRFRRRCIILIRRHLVHGLLSPLEINNNPLNNRFWHLRFYLFTADRSATSAKYPVPNTQDHLNRVSAD